MRHPTLLLTCAWLVVSKTSSNTRRHIFIISGRPVVSDPHYYHSTNDIALTNAKQQDSDWEAPNYMNVYTLFERAVIDTTDLLTTRQKYPSVTDQMYTNFIAMMNTVLLLSKAVAEHDWSYDEAFRRMAKKIVYDAAAEPLKSISSIKCYMGEAWASINRIEQLIRKDSFELVYNSKQRAACDAALFVFTKMDKDVEKEAELLFLLGDAGVNFKKLFLGENIHNKKSDQKVQDHMDELKHALKVIVNITAKIHYRIFNGEDTCVKFTKIQ